MVHLMSVLSRIFFIGSFLLLALAVWERICILFGYTLLRGQYTPWRLIEFAAVALIFVMVLQLRELKLLLRNKNTK